MKTHTRPMHDAAASDPDWHQIARAHARFLRRQAIHSAMDIATNAMRKMLGGVWSACVWAVKFAHQRASLQKSKHWGGL